MRQVHCVLQSMVFGMSCILLPFPNSTTCCHHLSYIRLTAPCTWTAAERNAEAMFCQVCGMLFTSLEACLDHTTCSQQELTVPMRVMDAKPVAQNCDGKSYTLYPASMAATLVTSAGIIDMVGLCD